METRLPFRVNVPLVIMSLPCMPVLLAVIAAGAQGNALPQRVVSNARGLLPAGAVLLKQMQVDFENKGAPAAVLLYQLTDRTDANRAEIGIKVAKHIFKFTGRSIEIASVEELPYGEDVPNLGPHGPLLRINVDEFWTYGFQLPDGFLVLGGSEGLSLTPIIWISRQPKSRRAY